MKREASGDVALVIEGGPAAQAGMREGDLIVRIGDTEIRGIDDLHRFLTRWPIGQAVAVTVVRGQEKLVLELTPVEAVEAPS